MERQWSALLFSGAVVGGIAAATVATDHSTRVWLADRFRWRDQALCPGCPPIRTSMTAAETACLQHLATGKRVVEIGSAWGYSTVAMAMVATQVIAIDPHVDLGSEERLRANLAAYGVQDRVIVIVAFSQAACARLQPGSADFVFIDGDHSYDVTLLDMECASAILVASAQMAVDDYGRIPSVTQAVDDFVTLHPEWTLSQCDELAVLTRG